MERKWTISLTAAAVIFTALAVLVEPALAADPKSAGKNIGDMLSENFSPLVLGVGGVASFSALFQQKYTVALGMVVLTIVVLGFFIQPSPYETWGIPLLKDVFSLSGTIGARP